MKKSPKAPSFVLWPQLLFIFLGVVGSPRSIEFNFFFIFLSFFFLKNLEHLSIKDIFILRVVLPRYHLMTNIFKISNSCSVLPEKLLVQIVAELLDFFVFSFLISLFL